MSTRKLAEVRRLRAELARLESFRHTDATSFEADHRVGAVLLDAAGRVLVERVPPPSRRSSLSGTSLLGAGRPRPEGYPQVVAQHAAEGRRSVLRSMKPGGRL